MFTKVSRILFLSGAIAAGCCLVTAGPQAAVAQGITTGALSGTVTDASGAVLPNTSVVALNVATGAKAAQNARQDGGFSLLSLPTGTYNLTFSAPGFADTEMKNVQVNVGNRDLGAISMKPSNVSTTVEVTGTTNELINTTEAQVSTTFDSMQIASLPLANGFDAITLLEPGIVQTHDNSFSNNNGASFSTNGQRGRSNNFEIDGQSNNDNSVAGPQVFFGNQDAISGIQVITNNFSAQYGRNMGTVVNYMTKTGTNHIHGTGFWLYEGNWGSAFLQGQKTPLFGYCAAGEDPADGCLEPTIPRFTYNIFGGTIGAPIIKDKLWGFAGLYWGRNHQGEGVYTSGTALFPTPDSLTALQAAGGGSGPVASLINSGPYSVPQGNPHPGAIVPENSTTFTVNGTAVPVDFAPVIRGATGSNDDTELLGRIDWQPTSRDHFFARYIYQDDPFLGAYGDSSATDIAAGHAYEVPATTHSIGADFTHTFSPSWVNQLRYSFQQSKAFFQGGSQPECTVNTPTLCNSSMAVSGNLADGVSTFLGYGYSSSFPQGRVVKVTQVQDNATWTHGRHTFSFGGEWSYQNSPNSFLPSYNGGLTSGSFQSFLDNSGTLTLGNGNYTIHFTEPDAAGYFQDDWKVMPDLTLNLGLRWEYFGQAVNLLHDETVTRESDPATAFWNTSLPLSARTFPAVPENYKNFQPRVGFAYNPREWAPRLVIRGGFAVNFDPEFYNMFLNSATAAPVVNLGTIPCSTLAPCIPSSGSTGADIRTQNLDKIPLGVNPNSRNQTLVSSDFHNPYAESWSFGFEYGINNSLVFEARYVGNHTVGLFQSLNNNPRLLQTAQAYPDVLSPSMFCSDPAQIGFRRTNCDQTRVRMRANTAFSNYNGLQLNLTSRQYHHLSGTFAYTYSRTIDNASEIFSTFTGGNSNTFAPNPFNSDVAERGVSGISIPNVASASLVYDVPFFEKQNGFVGKLLGGFQINGVWTYDTGQPVTPYMVDYGQLLGGSGPNGFPGFSNYCDGNFASGFNSSVSNCRPVLSNKKAPINATGIYLSPDTAANVWGIAPGYYTLDSAFNYLFGSPDLPTPTTPDAVHYLWNNSDIADLQGNPFVGDGRNNLRANGWDKIDASIYKTIKLHEAYALQLQFSAYNVLNKRLLGTNDPEVDDTGTFWNPDYNYGTSSRQVQLGARFTF
jgi:hypothetical protein